MEELSRGDENNMLKFILFFLLTSLSYADTVTVPTTYSTNGQVTSTNLNGNFSALASVMNGGLDNNNANTSGGYRFYETKSSLPSNGSQGRVVFNTSDNTLNFDNGSSWQAAVAPSGTLATGKIPYYNGGWQLLTPGSQYLPLVSNGASSLPSYQTLPAQGGGTGLTSYTTGDVIYSSASNTLSKLAVGSTNQVLTVSGGVPVWANAVTSYSTGSYLAAGPSAIVSTASGSFTKVVEMYVPRAGALTIKSGCYNSGSAGHSKIYRNGVAVGTQNDCSTLNTWVETSENISGWSVGDLLQVYAYNDGGSATVVAGAVRIYENVPVRESFTTGGAGLGSGIMIYSGAVAPNGKVDAMGSIGDLYINTSGGTSTTLYVKTGASTWTAK